MPHSFSITNRKIDPSRKHSLNPTPDYNDRVEIGPTDVAFREWDELGLTTPNLEQMRRYRLQRITDQLVARDYAGILCFDPLNIRYATDSSNMHLWIAHNPARAVFVAASGHMVLWDFHRCQHLSRHLKLIKEIRTKGASFFYSVAGDLENIIATDFANQINDLLKEHCGENRRLAVDRIDVPGLRALDASGVKIKGGLEVMELARVIKNIDEINAMRCALATCEIAVGKMKKALKPGIAETELWSILHAENIARGGEWIETRLLSSGPRTNPWMQEAGPRRLKDGDLLAFDTDLIGPYGMCADISRTWHCGDKLPSNDQRRLHSIAYEHVATNIELLKPGTPFNELTERGQILPDEFIAQRYSVMMHGVGLCDEFPAIYYPEDFMAGMFDQTVEHVLEPGMVLCVEAYIGAVGGKNGVKLEDQVLITETGHENMTKCPFDQKLN